MCEMCMNRRKFLAIALGGGCAAVAAPTAAVAQVYPLYCSWSGGGGMGQGLWAPEPLAVQQVVQVASVLQLPFPIRVFMGGVPNASATIVDNVPAIVYNSNFLVALSSCYPPAGMTVLAHEVGHHAQRDLAWAGQFRHPWTRELGADWVSGLAMKRLGASLDDTLSGIQCGMGPFSPGSPTHPDSHQRLVAIQQGWETG
jgi:hypothetical protein